MTPSALCKNKSVEGVFELNSERLTSLILEDKISVKARGMKIYVCSPFVHGWYPFWCLL